MKDGNNDYVSVTEIAGDEVTHEQVDRLCNRYYWAGEYCADKDVVEVACGSGQGLGYLTGISKSLEAGDYSDEILAIARRYYGERVLLRQFDAQDMPFEDKSKDVIILFEAIYYLPDVAEFVKECARVLRSEGKVLIATANKDLFDFNPSPHSHKYYGVVELRELFESFGFNVKLYGYMDVQSVSMRQRILRPIKFLASKAGIIPGSTQGKKWLKRIVFGDLVKMPAEIGPQITQISADYEMEEKNQQITPEKYKEHDFTEQAQITQNEKDGGTLYRGCYAEPERISLSRPDTEHKVIYCEATKIERSI